MKSIRVVAGKKTFCRRGHQRTAAFTGRCYRKDAGSIVHTLYERITTGRMDDPTPLPFTPGQCAVGIVKVASGDLKVGQRIYFDVYVESNSENNSTALAMQC